MKAFLLAFLGVALLTLPSLASGKSESVRTGTIKKGCAKLRDVKLCFNPEDADGPSDVSFVIAGRKTQLLTSSWPKFLEYQLARSGGTYSVKVGQWSTSDMPFFRYSEVVFRKSGPRYLASKYTKVSLNRCEGLPDLKVTYEINFARRMIATILDPVWTKDKKGRRYVGLIKLKTSDIDKLSEEELDSMVANAPGNGRLCKDYNG